MIDISHITCENSIQQQNTLKEEVKYEFQDLLRVKNENWCNK